MQKLVVLVGTSHVYQWAGNECAPGDVKKFLAFLTATQRGCNARAIAEEMSTDALYKHGQTCSTVKSLCDSMGLSHAYCDPEVSEQDELGIVNNGNILLGQQLCGWSDPEVQQRITEEYKKRERIWFECLQHLNAWPVVFICGSLHVDRFANLLRQHGYQVEIAASNWVA